MENKKDKKRIPAVPVRTLDAGTERYVRSRLAEERLNPNNFVNWYGPLSARLKSPRSVYVPLDLDRFRWLGGDSYAPDEILAFGEWLKGHVEAAAADGIGYPMFLKGATFSNKFRFGDCIVHENMDPRKLGENALDMYYTEMMVDRYDAGFVIREFIDWDGAAAFERIYGGMPLRAEFRVFYDFARGRAVGTYPYWDARVMLENLHGEDLATFGKAADRLAGDFDARKHAVETMVDTALAGFGGPPNPRWTSDVWSLDFMLDSRGGIWFIDAAVGFQSYYYDRLPQETRAADRAVMSDEVRARIREGA